MANTKIKILEGKKPERKWILPTKLTVGFWVAVATMEGRIKWYNNFRRQKLNIVQPVYIQKKSSLKNK